LPPVLVRVALSSVVRARSAQDGADLKTVSVTGFRILTDDSRASSLAKTSKIVSTDSFPAASFARSKSVSLINSAIVAQPVIVGFGLPSSSPSLSISASVLLNPCFDR
jgi:hypothetical protein